MICKNKRNPLEDYKELEEIMDEICKLIFKVSKLDMKKNDNSFEENFWLRIYKNDVKTDLVTLRYHFSRYITLYLKLKK